MTRPLRHIDEHADVLRDPGAHWPVRPRWTCDADGQPWPCEAQRNHMRATMPVQEIGIVMDGWYRFAVIELAAPPVEVHRQMLGWIRAAT